MHQKDPSIMVSAIERSVEGMASKTQAKLDLHTESAVRTIKNLVRGYSALDVSSFGKENINVRPMKTKGKSSVSTPTPSNDDKVQDSIRQLERSLMGEHEALRLEILKMNYSLMTVHRSAMFERAIQRSETHHFSYFVDLVSERTDSRSLVRRALSSFRIGDPVFVPLGVKFYNFGRGSRLTINAQDKDRVSHMTSEDQFRFVFCHLIFVLTGIPTVVVRDLANGNELFEMRE